MRPFDIYPAIDLLGGRVVRLLRGDYGQETRYGDDPVSRAVQFEEAGAPWIHVVDLDAARTGEPTNRGVIAAVAEAVSIPVQCGGGVRDIAAAEALAEAGVTRVVVGTAAVERPELVAEIAARQSVAVGLDARGRELATHGWERSSGSDLLEAARRCADQGASAVVVTEIGRDGTLEGPALEQLGSVLASTSVDVIASGGVGALEDIGALATLSVEGRSLAGAIVGKAIYEGRVDLVEALERARGERAGLGGSSG